MTRGTQPALSAEVRVLRVRPEGWGNASITIPAEVPFTLSANGTALASLMATPADLKALAIGFLYTSGFIHAVGDVLECRLDPDQWRVEVTLKQAPSPERLASRVLTAGCGSGVIYYQKGDLPERLPLESPHQFDRPFIAGLAANFQKGSSRRTGVRGIHTAALSTGEETPAFFMEDVGRHNAVDKIIGRALLSHLPLEGSLLITSGRVSSEILHKASRCGIPVLVSLGTPTHHAVLLATNMNITLIGLARGGGFTIFTTRERILL